VHPSTSADKALFGKMKEKDWQTLCGIWASSKSFLLAGSRRADRVVSRPHSGLLRPECQSGFRSHLRSCYKHGLN